MFFNIYRCPSFTGLRLRSVSPSCACTRSGAATSASSGASTRPASSASWPRRRGGGCARANPSRAATSSWNTRERYARAPSLKSGCWLDIAGTLITIVLASTAKQWSVRNVSLQLPNSFLLTYIVDRDYLFPVLLIRKFFFRIRIRGF